MTDHPATPLLTNLLVKKLMEEREHTPELEHAFPTMIRHSDAGNCARKIALKALGYEATEPMDAAGVWVTWLGSYVHEQLQAAILQVYPQAEIEAKVRWDDLSASGHCDALVVIDGKRIMWELKTKGGFGFDKAVGLDRKGYKLRDAEGPPASAKIQGALNAMAADADELRIGIIAMEAVSKGLASKVNWGDEARFLAEWAYPRSVFEPWAKRERARFAVIEQMVGDRKLPARIAVNDKMRLITLDPDATYQPWQCQYCGLRDTCSEFGPGEVQL